MPSTWRWPGRAGREMGTRSMGEGWIAVDKEALTDDRELRFWIDAVLEYNAEKTAER